MENLITRVPLMKNMMFLLHNQSRKVKRLKACAIDSTWICHLRLDHLNFNVLNLLVNRNIHHLNQLCESCLCGKQS